MTVSHIEQDMYLNATEKNMVRDEGAKALVCCGYDLKQNTIRCVSLQSGVRVTERTFFVENEFFEASICVHEPIRTGSRMNERPT